MTKAVAKQNDLGMVGKITSDKPLTQDVIDMVKKTVAKDANNEELQMFFYVARNYKLDPFLKEICFLKRRVWNPYKNGYDEVPSLMTTRDGFLSIAHRSGQFDGMETEIHYNQARAIEGATCTVWRKGSQHPIKVEVKFKEYCVMNFKTGKAQALWLTKPETMIKKVAESQALRKAFNIHGLYAHAEMEQEILKEAKGDLKDGEKQLELSEHLYKGEASYEDWSTELLTKMLDALKELTTVDAVKTWERTNQKELGLLDDSDRQYTRDCIDSRIDSVVKEIDWNIPLLTPIEAITSPQPHSVEINSLEKQEAEDKVFLKKAVSELLDIKDRFKLRDWLYNNRKRVSEMLPEINQQLETYFKAQWKASPGNDQLKYVWPEV